MERPRGGATSTRSKVAVLKTSPRTVVEDIGRPDVVTIGAWIGPRLVGSIRVGLEANRALLGRLAVVPDQQGQGIGTKLIMAVLQYLPEQTEEVWVFIRQWGSHEEDDLRAAIATCLLEHLLDAHFDLIFPRLETAAIDDFRFADTISSCWILIAKEHPDRLARFNRVLDRCRQINEP